MIDFSLNLIVQTEFNTSIVLSVRKQYVSFRIHFDYYL